MNKVIIALALATALTGCKFSYKDSIGYNDKTLTASYNGVEYTANKVDVAKDAGKCVEERLQNSTDGAIVDGIKNQCEAVAFFSNAVEVK